MAIKAFNSVNGFSVGEEPANIILANGDITTTNFTANGVSSLGPVGNVKITGGVAGQAIVTDGAGNLSFAAVTGSAAPMPYYIPPGALSVVPEYYQGLFSIPITIDGDLEVLGVLIEV